MSKEYNNWGSSLAIDTNPGPDSATCQCCSITQNSKMSWWRVDLKMAYPIRQIVIYGPEKSKAWSEFSGFSLYLSNISVAMETLIFTLNESDFRTTIYVPISNIMSRYVIISKSGVLTLCEIAVMEGDCPVGTFGEECLKKCHCLDNRPCDRITGKCVAQICNNGWHGESCDKECPADTFGINCSESCYCSEGTDCTKDHGICFNGCRGGYQGEHYNKACPHGWFGFKCTQQCHCLNNASCVNEKGMCESKQCDTGWQGVSCNEEISTVLESMVGSSLGVVIGSICGCALTVILAIVIAILIYRRIKAKRANDNNNEENTYEVISAKVDSPYDTIQANLEMEPINSVLSNTT